MMTIKLFTLVLTTLWLGDSNAKDFHFNDHLDVYLKKQLEATNPNYERSRFKDQMSQEFYEATIDKPIYEDDILAKKGLVGKTLTLDTRNKDVCEKVRDSLLRRFKDKKFLDLCEDSDQPLVSVTVFENGPKQLKFFLKEREEESKAISNKSVGEKLIDQTRNFAAGGLFMMGLIYALPTSISNWDKDDIKKNGLAKWKRNVKAGPVVDKDDWFINYIGHPMSGAAYHIVARHAGASAWESFGYGVLMSTFFWEYGIEAVAETPSIQDLILTPVIGSMLGEAFIKLEEHIYENDGLLLGSRRFGQFITGVMNPAEPVLNFINSGFESPFFKSLDIFLTIGPREIFLNEQESISVENETGISLELQF